MEKVINHRIEKNVERIGENNYYPTQIILDSNSLIRISDPSSKNEKWVHPGTNLVIERQNGGRMYAEVDGLCYIGVSKSKPEDYSEFDYYDLGEGKLGFYIIDISDKAISDGVVMGKGMQTYKRGQKTIVTGSEYLYDGDSELIAYKCKRSDGTETLEVFYSLGGWFGKSNPKYDEEVLKACEGPHLSLKRH